ncbi:MAG: GGDEF domain-containing protein, partial [Anaerolineales bacterium]
TSRPILHGYYQGGRIEQYVDISELKRLQQKLETLALTDELTNILNRRGLLEFGKRELAQARRYHLPLSILLFDLDHFKEINDQYGHTVGDSLLHDLIQRISKEIRDSDLFARYGGEEFVILLPDTASHQALILADRIRQKVAQEPFSISGQQIQITISIGIVDYNGEDDLMRLLEKADQAMYLAKQNGRNRIEALEMA